MIKKFLLIAVITFTISSCKDTNHQAIEDAAKIEVKNTFAKDNYTKKEVMITMRDGIKLHTTIYTPKDTSKAYPILMKRTPYSCKPYGENKFPAKVGPNTYLMEEGNIMVYQDVRGRWNSEGVYDNMRPYIPNKTGNQFDEASDTYDTIEWLINNVAHNNGNVGTYGISYPGFYATYSLLDAHPALKAVSPQACIGDFFFDDFIHNGAYLLSYWRATSVFGYMKDKPTKQAWYEFPDIGTEDQYQFFLDNMPLRKLDGYYGEDNVFILLGSGDAGLEQFLTEVASRYKNFIFLKGYAETLSEHLYNSGDLFLMPSSFEPCGISQMLSMRAGQPCLAHSVGGLSDTIVNNENGFTFNGKTPNEQAENMLFVNTQTIFMTMMKIILAQQFLIKSMFCQNLGCQVM